MKFRFTFVALLLLSNLAHAQLIERPNKDGAKPFEFDLNSPSDDIAISPDDQYVVVNDQENVFLFDTSMWDAASPQPDPLDSVTESYDFAPNSLTLFAHQNDGFIGRILVTDPVEDFLNDDLSAEIGTGAAKMAMAPEATNGNLFLLNPTSKKIFRYNMGAGEVDGSIDINVPNVNTVNNIAYVGGNLNQIYISTSESRVIIYSEELAVVTTLLLSGTHPDCPSNGDPDAHVLPAVGIHPDNTFAFVINSTDNVVHVVDALTLTEVDTSPLPGTNPICLHQNGPNGIDQDINSDLRDIVLTRVKNPLNAPRGFVTGDRGVAILNATPGEFGVIDAGDTGNNDPEEIEPIQLVVAPNFIVASSTEDGYLYTANVDDSISVISDNPFVTIVSVNPETLTKDSTEFDLTFQVDELCDGCQYRVVAGGDIHESGGQQLFEGAFTNADTVNTDITTPKIQIGNSLEEGDNQIFIFSEDAAGNVGRDSVIVAVDLPPPLVKVIGVGFGNKKGYVTVERLTQEDIKEYQVIVLEAEDQKNPQCPGNLIFENGPIKATADQPEEGGNVKIEIPNLVNGTAYCVGVQAEDDAGNLSGIGTADEPIIPEETVGITGASGETGCQLNPSESGFGLGAILWVLSLSMLVGFRLVSQRPALKLSAFKIKKWSGGVKILLILLTLTAAKPASAYEITDQHWTFQFQGGFFLPTDPEVDKFLGKCCNGMYNLSFGWIHDSKYEVNLGVGLMSEGAFARGINSDRVSEESFNFTVVPITTSFIYHADFVENQFVVPYVNVGLDYLVFRENLQGDVTSGMKYGYHVAAGLQILLEFFDESADALEEYGVNDTYLTLEGRWQQIDNFGGKGLAFNGGTFSAGLLFLF